MASTLLPVFWGGPFSTQGRYRQIVTEVLETAYRDGVLVVNATEEDLRALEAVLYFFAYPATDHDEESRPEGLDVALAYQANAPGTTVVLLPIGPSRLHISATKIESLAPEETRNEWLLARRVTAEEHLGRAIDDVVRSSARKVPIRNVPGNGNSGSGPTDLFNERGGKRSWNVW